MSRGMPSMVALLGLLAVAGYQNRDKIAEMLGGLKQEPGGGSGLNSQQAVWAACSAIWAGSSAVRVWEAF